MSLHPEHTLEDIQQVIFDAIDLTNDGVGIFDHNDILIYSNHRFTSLFDIDIESAIGLSFEDIIRHDFEHNHGLNIESENINEWIALAQQKRRSKPYRKFEVDKKSGQWFLVTEQIVNKNFLYVYITDITEKKNNERALETLSNRLKKHASIDHLTDIYNRRYFYKMAKQEFSRCIREKSKSVVMMMDLDDFKKINDVHGHATGDFVIKSFATIIKKSLRDYDIFGRVGGEEFAILFPNTSISEAKHIAERIRKSIEKKSILYDGKYIELTVSIGLSQDLHTNDMIDDVIKTADKHLLKAKSSGKNRISSP